MNAAKKWGVGALALALVVSLSACASDDTNAGATSGPSASGGGIDVKLAQKYSGLEGSGEAKKTPITLGLINQEGGLVSNPEFRVAAQAAADYLNKELGGIDGHPVTFDSCNVVSAESDGQKCGQEMLAKDDVKFIIQGGLNIGTQAFHATVDGKKPVLIAVANPGPDATAANSFALNASSLAGKATTPIFMSQVLKAKTVAMIADDNPGNQAIAKGITQGLEAAGITVKLTTYPAGSSDLLTPLAAVGSSGADVIQPISVTPTACIAMAKAYEQSGLTIPLYSSGLCASDAVKKALGDFPKWIYSGTMLQINAPDKTGQVDLYKAIMAKYAPEGAELGSNAPAGFSSVFAAAKILAATGADKLSTDTIAATAKDFSGPLLMGSPVVKFGGNPQLPTIGSFAALYYDYKGDGTWTDASDGWVNLPK